MLLSDGDGPTPKPAIAEVVRCMRYLGVLMSSILRRVLLIAFISEVNQRNDTVLELGKNYTEHYSTREKTRGNELDYQVL